MPFTISPGVNTSEIDLTTVVPAVSTTEGAAVGPFLWGPMEQRVLVESENRLVARFGKPDSTIYPSWFTAANFLAYGNKLYVVRIANTSAVNATSEDTTGGGGTGTGLLVKNDDYYENNYADGSANVGQWCAKYPGAIGNTLKVSMCGGSAAYSSSLTGTVTITANTTTVTGDGTSFDTEVVSGDILKINNLERKVASVTNSTSIILATRHVDGAAANTAVRYWEYYNKVDVAPGTSTYANNVSGTNDEMHVVVVDEDGKFTGVPGQTLEVFEGLSKASDAKTEEGGTNYYKNIINNVSEYIRWLDHSPDATNAGSEAASTTFGANTLPETFSLAGGADGSTATDAQKKTGFDFFNDAADVDVSIILGADSNTNVANHIIDNICEIRKDCVVCLSPEYADVVNNAGSETDDSVAFRNTLTPSSYAILDSGWKYQYDRYNDVYRWAPLNGDIGGLMVQTDSSRDPWWSPAGYNRGNIKNIIKLAYNPTKAHRDQLYKAGINPVVTFPGQGTVLFGDKTLLDKPSAFDRINVRRLFIVLEKAIATAAKFSLFEFNDEFTRAQFVNLVEPFLRDVQGRRGIFDFQVVCDDTNNTGEVIDRNEFIGDIYVKPARSINFIQLNFVAVRTGVEFSEVIGQF